MARLGATKGMSMKILRILKNWKMINAALDSYEEDAKKKVTEYEAYEQELRPLADPYFEMLERIERNWSVIYNSNAYHSDLADQLAEDCFESIQLYEKLCAFYKKHGEKTPPSAPAFKRLAMLFERQEEYEMAIAVCRRAILSGETGSNPASRLIRLAKKANRNLTDEELELVGLK